VAEVLQEFNALDFMLECRVVFSWAAGLAEEDAGCADVFKGPIEVACSIGWQCVRGQDARCKMQDE
jgi:hypothetical protein